MISSKKEKHPDEKHSKKAERLKNNLSVHHTKKKKHKEKDKHEHRSSHKEKHQSKHHNHSKGKDVSEKLSHKHKEHNSSSKKSSSVSYLNSEKLSDTTITPTKNKSWLNKSASNETDPSIISELHSIHVQNTDFKSDSQDILHSSCNNKSHQNSIVSCDGSKSSESSDEKCSDSVKSEMSSQSATDRTCKVNLKRKFDSDPVNIENTDCKMIKLEIVEEDTDYHIKTESVSSTQSFNASDTENVKVSNAENCSETNDKCFSENDSQFQESKSFSLSTDHDIIASANLNETENSNERNILSLQSSSVPEVPESIKGSVESDCDSISASDVIKNEPPYSNPEQTCTSVPKELKSENKLKEQSLSNKINFISCHSTDKSDVLHISEITTSKDKETNNKSQLLLNNNLSNKKKEAEINKHSKVETKISSIRSGSAVTPSKDKIKSEKHKPDKLKHELKNFDKIKSKFLKNTENVVKKEKKYDSEKKSKHSKEGKTHKSNFSSSSNQSKQDHFHSKDVQEKDNNIKSKNHIYSAVKNELCLRCKQKLTSHRNVSIQCKRDRHDKLIEKIGVSQKIPRLPQGLDMRHLKYGKYIRLEVYPNGGAALLHLYWDEISHLHHKELRALAEEFLKVSNFLIILSLDIFIFTNLYHQNHYFI